jgi:hypothetical protein
MASLRIGIVASVLVCLSSALFPTIFSIRGGRVPQATKIGGEYIELFEDLDYGCSDTVRGAGALSGKFKVDLRPFNDTDPFVGWLTQQMKSGFTVTDRLTPSSSDRIKPFHVRRK